MRRFVPLLALFVMVPVANAADVEAGKSKVAAVCAACHGVNGVSVSDAIPNLAGQNPPTSRRSCARSRTGRARTRS